MYGTCFTDDVVNKKACSLKEVKKVVYSEDRKRQLERCRDKASLIVAVAEGIGWSKLVTWHMILDGR